LENWAWPTRYDPSYLPRSDDKYWFPERETMDPDRRDDLILERIVAVMSYAWEKSPFYREKWSEAGIHPSGIKTLEDFERVPVVKKAELGAEQARHEPFGDYLCVSPDEVKHVHGTSGTTGRPTAFGISGADWDNIANAHARVMWSMGIRPSDTVLVGSFFSLYLGSWGALIGTERLGARAFPFGAGVAGQTVRCINWMQQMRPTVFYGTPSYALHLAETALEHDVDPGSLGLRILFFSGEPGASVPPIRARLEALYQARVFDTGSMSEVGAWMNLGESDESGGVLCWQDVVYTEVCDPTTMTRVPYGSEGTPVYTTLERTSQPMIRLLSNDLTRWTGPSSACSRTYPILPRGVYGRIDDMFTIRGENIYPTAIDEVVMEDGAYGGEHRIVISREEAMDQLLVQVECDQHRTNGAPVEIWARNLGDRLRTVLGVRAVVHPLERNTLERSEFKSRRVIDNRDLLRRILDGADHEVTSASDA
jgi:phenylacetate-CoA ligase